VKVNGNPTFPNLGIDGSFGLKFISLREQVKTIKGGIFLTF